MVAVVLACSALGRPPIESRKSPNKAIPLNNMMPTRALSARHPGIDPERSVAPRTRYAILDWSGNSARDPPAMLWFLLG